MASKSRLGKGLGALFPTLPEDIQTTESHDADSDTSSGSEHGSSVETNEQSVELAGSSEITKEAHRASDSMEEQRAKSDGFRVSRETSKHSVQRRAAIPSLEDLSRPSDVFFGEQHVQTKQEQSRTGTSSIHEGRGKEKTKHTPSPENDVGTSGSDQANQVTVESSVQRDLQPVVGGYLAQLKVEDIRPNAHQPRAIFDDDELQELADSITEVGILQPIVVRKRDNDTSPGNLYELVMGERRWRASQLAGLTTIPAIVKTTSDDDMLRDALLENLHRVDLNPLEEAAAYQQMIDEFGLTQSQLSKSISKSRPQIANTLRLLNLPGAVQKRVAAGVLSAGHARALLSAGSEQDMEVLADRIVAEGLSVRDAEEIVALKHSDNSQHTPRARSQNPWAGSEIQTKLEDRFDTRVIIRGSHKKGRIEIVFSSQEDMNRILQLLAGGDPPQSGDWV